MDAPGYVCFLFWNTWLYNLLRFFIWGDMTAVLHLILLVFITEYINNNTVQKHKNCDCPIVTVIGKEHEGSILKLSESSSGKHKNSGNQTLTVIKKEHEGRIEMLPESSCVKHKNCDSGVITAIGKEHEEHIKKCHESSCVKLKNSGKQTLTVIKKEHEGRIETLQESSCVKHKNCDSGVITVIGREFEECIQKLPESSSVNKMEDSNESEKNEFGVKDFSEMKPRRNGKVSLSSNVLDTGSLELIKELVIDLQAPYSKASKWVFQRRKYQC